MTQEVKLKRVRCNYESQNARFLLECDFSKQYNLYYQKRLEKTRTYLEFNCRSKWDPEIPIYSISEIAAFSVANSENEEILDSTSLLSSPSEDGGNYKFSKRIRLNSLKPTTSTQNEEIDSGHCIVIGTIFKRMKLQPDVIEELIRGDFHVKCERYLGHYTSPDDTLVLEDTDESISLVGNINPKRIVTGVVVALYGLSIDDGSQFLVRDICFAEPNRQILYEDILERPLEDRSPIYLMILSGLNFHHDMDKDSKFIQALQDMIDFVWGGSKFVDDDRSSRVSRILIVGNCLSENRLKSNENILLHQSDEVEIATRMKKSRQVKPYIESIQAVNHMDDFFSQLSKTIDVDVMPGSSDPSSHLMPQQPFHPCMFPKSCMFSTFNCTTNPYHAIYNNDVEVFATSSQNIDIVSKFSCIEDPIDVMKCHLMWGNCAPSAPDNLYSVPYEEDDPYVIDFIPEIYIAGCQKSFKTDYYYYESSSSSSQSLSKSFAGETFNDKASDEEMSICQKNSRSQNNLEMARKSRTLLVSVPQFSETFSCVLINLKNLECQLLPFD